MKKIFKQKKGFTLIELIIAIAVLSIFTLAAANIMFPVLNTYFETQKLADSNMVCSSVLDTIRKDVSIATDKPEVSQDGHKISLNCKYGKTEYFSGEDRSGNLEYGKGFLYRSDVKDALTKPVFDDSFYKDKTIEIVFDETKTNVYKITASVFDGEELICSQNTLITPLIYK